MAIERRKVSWLYVMMNGHRLAYISQSDSEIVKKRKRKARWPHLLD